MMRHAVSVGGVSLLAALLAVGAKAEGLGKAGAAVPFLPGARAVLQVAQNVSAPESGRDGAPAARPPAASPNAPRKDAQKPAPAAASAGRPVEEINATAFGCVQGAFAPDVDVDFRRVKLDPAEFCVSYEQFQDAGETWKLEIIQHWTHPGILWVVPHDNEDAAFDSAIALMRQYGGTVVAVETGEKRNNVNLDPNRAFGERGFVCKRSRPAPEYTRRVLRFRAPNAPIVALHTNRLDGNISIRSPEPGEKAFPARPQTLIGGDHHLIFLASAPGVIPPLERAVRSLNEEGVNVIVEQVTYENNDCSLSNYATLKNLPYFTVEVPTGDSAAQIAMTHKAMRILALEPESPPPAGGGAALQNAAGPPLGDTAASQPQGGAFGSGTTALPEARLAAPQSSAPVPPQPPSPPVRPADR